MHRTTALKRAIEALGIAAVIGLTALPSSAEPSGTISGRVFEDSNANAVFDKGDVPLANQQLYVFDSTRQAYFGTALSDAAGHYELSGLAPADYSVEFASSSWQPLKLNSVPTTTGSIYPRQEVHLTGNASADFGWRPIQRSTTLGAPMSSVVGPSGLRVESYNDAVPAPTLYDALGTALLGQEASHVIVRFDYGPANTTTTGVQQAGGIYSDYSAVSYVTFGSWLEGGDQTLVHEYGHAWSLYFANIVQQDPTLGAYVHARGLDGDPRLNSSYTWSVREMIAEDYRQLFGSANAASRPQANTDLPPAAAVPGLATFLRDQFTTPPAPNGGDSAPDEAVPDVASISDLTVSPQPIAKSGVISFVLSGPASLRIRILDSSGAVVRTLLDGVTEGPGTVNATWNRSTSTGRRAPGGAYVAVVDATSVATVSAQVSFQVK